MRFIILLLMIGCAPTVNRKIPNVNTLTAEAIIYEIEDFNDEDLLVVINWTLGLLEENLNGWSFGLINGFVKQPSQDDSNAIVLADGVTYPDKQMIFVFAWQRCLADSALIHEIFHALKYDVHTKKVEKIITRITKLAIIELCPEGYESTLPPPSDAEIRIKGRNPLGEYK